MKFSEKVTKIIMATIVKISATPRRPEATRCCIVSRTLRRVIDSASRMVGRWFNLVPEWFKHGYFSL